MELASELLELERQRSELLEQQAQEQARERCLELRLQELAESRQFLVQKKDKIMQKPRHTRCPICKCMLGDLVSAEEHVEGCLLSFITDAAAAAHDAGADSLLSDPQRQQLMEHSPTVYSERSPASRAEHHAHQHRRRSSALRDEDVSTSTDSDFVAPEPEQEYLPPGSRSPSLVSREGSYVDDFRTRARAQRRGSPLCEGLPVQRTESHGARASDSPGSASDVDAVRERVAARAAQTKARATAHSSVVQIYSAPLGRHMRPRSPR